MAKKNNFNNNFDRFSASEIRQMTEELSNLTNQLQSYNMQLDRENKEYNVLMEKLNKATKSLGLSQNNLHEVIQYVREADKYLEVTTEKMLSLDAAMNKVNSSSKKFSAQNLISDAKQKNAAKIYEQERSALVEVFKKEGKNINSKEFDSKFNENVTQALSKSSGKYDKASAVMSLAANTFHDAVKTFTGIFMNGVHEQRDIYNKTFTNIAVRTGMQSSNSSRTGYLDRLWDLPQELDKRGLFDNIAGSTVQEMWNTMATTGLGQEQIFANAIDTVLTNTVVPYLDTSSAAFQQYMTWQPQLMKQVRGIGASTMDISGSAVFATEHLQEMVNELTPVSQQATEELGVQYAKTSGLYESLRQQGLSDSAIGELFYAAKSGVKDPLKALQSGNLDQQMAFMDVYANGDLTNIYDWATAGLNASLTNASWVGGTGNNRALQANVISGKTSLGYGSMLELANKDLSSQKAIEAALKGGNNLNEYANAVTEAFTKGDMQTEQEKQTNYLENLSTKVAVIEGKMGVWSDVVENLVKGIGGLFATWIGGKLISGTVGQAITGSLGTGGSLLAGASGVAVGAVSAVAAVAIGAAIGNAVATAIQAAQQKEKEETESGLTAEYMAKGKSKSAATFRGVVEASKDSQSYGSEELAKYGIEKTWWLSNANSDVTDTMNKKAERHNWPEYNQALAFKIYAGAAFDKEYQARALLAYAIALNENNMLSGLDKLGLGITSSNDIKEIIADYGYDVIDVFAAFEGIAGEGTPRRADGSEINYSDLRKSLSTAKKYFDIDSAYEEKLKGIGYHRHGLNYVPYDDYPALLHEGETVLTASTADELRLLLDEYRATRQQSANMDAIIQNQTTALINEMERIIDTIQNNNAFSTSDNLDYVRSSMKSMKSTTSFNG